MQGINGVPSTEHWKVAPAWVEVKVKVALRLPLSSGGPERMMVSGSPSVIQV